VGAGRDRLPPAAEHLPDVECQIDLLIWAHALAAERQEGGKRLGGKRRGGLHATRFDGSVSCQTGVDRGKQFAGRVREIFVILLTGKDLSVRRDDPDTLVLIFLALDGEKKFTATVSGLTHMVQVDRHRYKVLGHTADHILVG